MKNTNNIQIDENVPTPQRGSWATIVKEMKLGDSVLVKTVNECRGIRQAVYTQGFKAVTRHEGNGWRIWKAAR
jgi:hypothetical protein